MQDHQIWALVLVMFLPELAFYLVKLKRWLEVVSVAHDFNFFFWNGHIDIGLGRNDNLVWIVVVSEQVLDFDLHQSFEQIFVNFVEAKGTSCFENTLGDRWEIVWADIWLELEPEHIVNAFTMDLFLDQDHIVTVVELLATHDADSFQILAWLYELSQSTSGDWGATKI